MKLLWFIVSGLLSPGLTLDNGLALTPPMGWLTWERFGCNTDCVKFPQECISEFLIKRTADIMVNEGYLAAGYNYIAIDDCWLEKTRDVNNCMVPDRKRFPNGMKALADYVHERGLQFGLNQDYGTKTCAGYPGVLGYEEIDVRTFAEWEVDYVKLNGCYIDPNKMDTGFPAFGKLLNETGRPILYSCSWPAYQDKPNYDSIEKHCNLWRNYVRRNIQDSWTTVKSIMTWFAENQDKLVKHAGPGHWNDPDMLIIGNYGLSLDQARVQMAVWAVLAAPLLMSVDLATIRPEFKEILLNSEIISVDQDPLGKQGLRVWNGSKCEIWKRDLVDGCYAIAFVNLRDDDEPYSLQASFDQMNIPQGTYKVKDLYRDEECRLYGPEGTFETRINSTGVRFYMFTKYVPHEIEDTTTILGN